MLRASGSLGLSGSEALRLPVSLADDVKKVDGVATARAVVKLAAGMGIEMPVTAMVNALALGRIALNDAIGLLMSRPLKQE